MSTTTRTATETEEVLAAMLTENTGRHMLDSGGAYGRNWERNSGKTVEDFLAAPEIETSTWQRDGHEVIEYVSLDLFHFLRQRLEYDAETDAAFHAFAADSTEPWFADLESWLESIGATHEEAGRPFTVNTYNGEDCLSQVIQYTVFDVGEDRRDYYGDVYIALSIHGGCDVRGGYTAPRIFRADSYALYDNADFTLDLLEPDPSPAEAAQGYLVEEYPARKYGRRVSFYYQGGYAERCTDGDVGDDVEFIFGETPVTKDGDRLVIAEGPGKGWEVSIHPPFPSC